MKDIKKLSKLKEGFYNFVAVFETLRNCNKKKKTTKKKQILLKIGK